MYNIDWILPKLRSPKGKFWNFASTLTLAAVGLFSKIVIVWFNKTRVHNENILYNAIENRRKNVPLLTISNHHSCFDDPGLWVPKMVFQRTFAFHNFVKEIRVRENHHSLLSEPSMPYMNFKEDLEFVFKGILKLKHLINRERMRWSLAAQDICFTNKFHSYFFLLGKCVPIIRGRGVYQKYMDFCLDILKKGYWLHIFPEGRVNMEKTFLRFKWGVGRLIYELPVLPVIIPIWHVGMDDVLPNYPPYILKFGNKVTMNFGKPIDIRELVERLKSSNVSDEEARKAITDHIQDELMKLKEETEALHQKHIVKGS